ncbi:unnamed protein product [Meganyctiphanes norvegica]|uniref:SSD domain-containing protein n=1 Tax=Meganyctiphanes norvegica TaxID=48144 RepID=A0AAV2SB90_MEGNR
MPRTGFYPMGLKKAEWEVPEMYSMVSPIRSGDYNQVCSICQTIVLQWEEDGSHECIDNDFQSITGGPPELNIPVGKTIINQSTNEKITADIIYENSSSDDILSVDKANNDTSDNEEVTSYHMPENPANNDTFSVDKDTKHAPVNEEVNTGLNSEISANYDIFPMGKANNKISNNEEVQTCHISDNPVSEDTDINNISDNEEVFTDLVRENPVIDDIIPVKKSGNNASGNEETTYGFIAEKSANEDMHQSENNTCNLLNIIEWLSCGITRCLENKFEAHGRHVACHPYKAALICTLVSLICCVGNINFTIELKPFKLWLPQDSDFIKVLDWQANNFPIDYRFHGVVWESDNILTAQAIKEMWRTHQQVYNLVVPGYNITWIDVCAKIPTLLDYDTTSMDTDMSFILPRKTYCSISSELPSACFEVSLLEVWGLNNEVIMNLTDDKVIQDINNIKVSAVFGYQRDFTSMLGGTEKDNDGQIISAKAAKHIWVTILDYESISLGDAEIDEGTGSIVDSAGLLFETAWVNTVLNDTGRDPNIKLYGQAASSFGKVSEENIYGDVKWLALGFSLMFAFVNMTLGRRNQVEQRPLLSLFGLLSCGFAIGISYGICSAFNVLYSPVNSILPILLIGLGVDDMFVILAAWEAESKKKPCDSDLVERAAKTMRHAGVAITVTSLTDVTAFVVGASTDLPALRSFCIYASVGIFSVYLLQATFFLAWLIKDEQRMKENRHGLLWFIKFENWESYSCSKRDLLNEFFAKVYSEVLMKTPVRFVIIILSALLVGASLWATSNLRQEFNPMDFIPSSSYVYKWFNATATHFPTNGEPGYIYIENAKLPEDLPALHMLVNKLEHSEAVESVSAWFTQYKYYISQHPDHSNITIDETTLPDTLSLFLSSSYGEVFKSDIHFNGAKVDCSKPSPNFTTFRISILQKPASHPAKQLETMTTINTIVNDSTIHGSKYVWSQAYSIWETNQIIAFELYRNLILAGVVIAVITLILLASFWCSVLVLTSVAFTIVGVSGVMWAWGLTIDTVSCIAIVLAIGLSVDYCAHIAHAFLAAREKESRVERVKEALIQVGPAVTNGAFSTFLAFALLGMSTSHVFITFFKVFMPAVIFGYFYGVVFLPVVLSIIGPPAYANTGKLLTVDKQPSIANDKKRKDIAFDKQKKQQNNIA